MVPKKNQTIIYDSIMEQTKDKPSTVDRNDAWKKKKKLEPIRKEIERLEF